MRTLPLSLLYQCTSSRTSVGKILLCPCGGVGSGVSVPQGVPCEESRSVPFNEFINQGKRTTHGPGTPLRL